MKKSVASKPHICIVGAGVAGLRCADVMLRRWRGGVEGPGGTGGEYETGGNDGNDGNDGNGGVRITVVEGRGRIGGRVSFI